MYFTYHTWTGIPIEFSKTKSWSIFTKNAFLLKTRRFRRKSSIFGTITGKKCVKTFVIFHGENFDDSIIIRENVILVYSRMKSSRTHLSFTSWKWTWAPVFSQTNIFHNKIKISEISRQEKSGQKSQKGSKTIMNDQLMREKVKDLSFLNLEFHFERLICVKIVKKFWNFSSLKIPDHP